MRPFCRKEFFGPSVSYCKRWLSTLNLKEVEKFGRVGEDWWNSSSHSGTGPLHAMNPVRVEFIRKSVAKKLGREHMIFVDQIKGLKVLDIGCGGGILCEALARLGAQVTGIDPASQSIDVAHRHSQCDLLTKNINYRSATVEDIVKSGEQFDVVCSLEVLRGHVVSCLSLVNIYPFGSILLIFSLFLNFLSLFML